MKLKTTLGEINEFLDEHCDLIMKAGWFEIQESENNLIELAGYKIQIPALKVYIRPGDLLYKDEDDDDAEWEADASINALYDLNEESPENYLDWSSDSIEVLLYNHFRPRFSSPMELEEIECIIEVLNFSDD